MTTAADLQRQVLEIGMLPYFAHRIPGFSVEENVPPDILWRVYDGPWDWKGTVIREWKVAYGKFFKRKAGYISLDLLPDFLNLRRALFPLERHAGEKRIYDILVANDSLLSSEYKALSGFARKKAAVPGNLTPIEKMLERKASRQRRDVGFDTLVARLQMGGWVVIADFEYKHDRQGNRYGWGVARYTTPEALYGDGILDVEGRTPMQSRELLVRHISAALPDVPPYLIFGLLNL